jgi:hypothetical protein
MMDYEGMVLVLLISYKQLPPTKDVTLHYITSYLNTGSEQTRPTAGMWKESSGRSNLLEKRYNETI